MDPELWAQQALLAPGSARLWLCSGLAPSSSQWEPSLPCIPWPEPRQDSAGAEWAGSYGPGAGGGGEPAATGRTRLPQPVWEANAHFAHGFVCRYL